MKTTWRNILVLILMLGVLAAAYGLGFSKANARRQQLAADVIAKRKALGDLAVATVGIDDLNRKATELTQAINFFRSRLPQEREMDKILAELASTAADCNLQTKTIKPLRIERMPAYSEQPIQLTLSGDFESFYAFLLKLERLPRVTRVMQMQLTRGEHDGTITAAITLSVYFVPDQSRASVQ